MGRKRFRIPGVTFSPKRALGITSAKRRLARMTGIPTTRGGRRRKFGPFGAWWVARRTSGSAVSPSDGTSALGCVAALLAVLLGVPLVLLCGCGALFGLGSFVPPSRDDDSPTTRPRTTESGGTKGKPATNQATGSVGGDQTNAGVGASSTLRDETKSAHAVSGVGGQIDTSAPKEPLRETTSKSGEDAGESPENPGRRTWMSADGKYSVNAEFMSMTAGIVKLKRSDGKIVEVPIENLSETDRQFLEDYRKARGGS